MLNYTIRRLLIAIPVFLALTFITFAIARWNPDGGALSAYIGPGHHVETTAQLNAIKARLGLNVPWFIAYFYWLRNLFQGDLGVSVLTHEPVLRALGERLPATLLLTVPAFVFQETLAVTLGIFSALRKGSFFDEFFSFIAYAFFAVPTFWLGLVLIIILGVELPSMIGWGLPFNGILNVRLGIPFGTPLFWSYYKTHFVSTTLDIIGHMIMPWFTLMAVGIAGDSRFMRGQMLGVLNMDYIRTARAKGLPSRIIVWKHSVRNAIIPIVTNIGLTIPGLIGGAIITEQIFGIEGTGHYFIEAAQSEDYPVVIAMTVLIGGLVILFNILTDLTYGLVDPRIRYD